MSLSRSGDQRREWRTPGSLPMPPPSPENPPQASAPCKGPSPLFTLTAPTLEYESIPASIHLKSILPSLLHFQDKSKEFGIKARPFPGKRETGNLSKRGKKYPLDLSSSGNESPPFSRSLPIVHSLFSFGFVTARWLKRNRPAICHAPLFWTMESGGQGAGWSFLVDTRWCLLKNMLLGCEVASTLSF